MDMLSKIRHTYVSTLYYTFTLVIIISKELVYTIRMLSRWDIMEIINILFNESWDVINISNIASVV